MGDSKDYKMIVAITYLVFLQAVLTESACYLGYCRPADCNGFWCTRCQDGHYLDTTYTTSRHYCKPCPPSCLSCDGYEDCSECHTRRYGYLCQSVNCSGCKDNICDKDSGSCINGCADSYFSDINGTCIQCPQRCSLCSSSHLCTQCRDVNYWGSICQYACGNCASCNKYNGCSSRCNDGYYQLFNNNIRGYECLPCPGTCTSCNTINNCQSCSPGYWGRACQHTCGNCASCSKYNGCSSRCNDGYYRNYNSIKGGYECKQCLPRCASCTNYTNCESCTSTSYWGATCQHTCTACNGGLCNSKTGKCTYVCASDEYFMMDYSGQGCFKCPGNCSSCSSASQCLKCSENCKNTTEKSCYESDGYCINGCKIGWYGRQCNERCNKNCNGNICDRINGACIAGCNDGYTGSTCMQALLSDDSSGPNTAAIGGGIGSTVAVLVIAALIVVIVVQRRRLTNANREHADDLVVAYSQATEEASNYENLAIITTTPTQQDVPNSVERASTYQELNKEIRGGIEHTTLDDITPTL